MKLGLEGEIEKHSDVLGRTVPWNKKMEISSLPKYLCVEVCFLFLNSFHHFIIHSIILDEFLISI